MWPFIPLNYLMLALFTVESGDVQHVTQLQGGSRGRVTNVKETIHRPLNVILDTSAN